MKKNVLLLITLFVSLAACAALGGTNDKRASSEIKKEMMDITIDGKVVKKIPVVYSSVTDPGGLSTSSLTGGGATSHAARTLNANAILMILFIVVDDMRARDECLLWVSGSHNTADNSTGCYTG